MKRYSKKPLSKAKELARKLRDTQETLALERQGNQEAVNFWKRSAENANAKLRSLAGSHVELEDFGSRIRLAASVEIDAHIQPSQTSLIAHAISGLAEGLHRQVWLHMLAPTAKELESILDKIQQPTSAFEYFIYEWNYSQERPLHPDAAQRLFFSVLQSIPKVVKILREDASGESNRRSIPSSRLSATRPI